MSLTQQIIKDQSLRQVRSGVPKDDTCHGLSAADIQKKQKELEKVLQEERAKLQKLQDARKDESGVRLDERQNISIKRKRQIEKHRNRYVKEGIKHKTEAEMMLEQQEVRRKKAELEATQRTSEQR